MGARLTAWAALSASKTHPKNKPYRVPLFNLVLALLGRKFIRGERSANLLHPVALGVGKEDVQESLIRSDCLLVTLWRNEQPGKEVQPLSSGINLSLTATETTNFMFFAVRTQ